MVSKTYVKVPVVNGKVDAEMLSKYGVNVDDVLRAIDEKVKLLMKYGLSNLYAEVEFDVNTKEIINVRLDLPPVTSLLLKAVGKESGSHQSIKEVIGNLSINDVAEIAYIMWEGLRCKSFKSALKQVLSTCRSIGITVEGKDPRDVIKEVDGGAYDSVVKAYEERIHRTSR